MQKGKILVKEVVGSGIESFHIDSCLSTPFPVKDIFQVRYKVLPVRSIVGKTCVAYFGEVEFKVYCVCEHDHCVRLVSEKLHYKGFCFFPETRLHSKPEIKAITHVKDVFTEIMEPESIQIFAVLATELILTANSHEIFEHRKDQVSDDNYEIEILDKDISSGISVEVI